MDYSKFEHISEDGVRDKESSGSRKPGWALLIEKKDLVQLRALLDQHALDLTQSWSGERHRWQTPGNFQDEREEGTYTPLGYAVCWNKPEVVELLLARGADPKVPIIVNKAERTLLSVAQSRNHKKVIQLLKAALAK